MHYLFPILQFHGILIPVLKEHEQSSADPYGSNDIKNPIMPTSYDHYGAPLLSFPFLTTYLSTCCTTVYHILAWSPPFGSFVFNGLRDTMTSSRLIILLYLTP